MKVLLFLLAAVALRGAPEFVGYWAIGNDIAFAVVEPGLEAPPRWVQVGSEFAGYRVVEFRANSEVLVLRKEGQSLELNLRKGRVRQGSSEISALDAYAVAIREIQKREVWAAKGRFEAPQRGAKSWLIPVFRRLEDGSEDCIIVGVAMADGSVAEYRYFTSSGQKPNKAPEPTPGAVTPRATEGTSK